MAIHGIAGALRLARNAKQMSQEEFEGVSSRIYISELERGMKKPTLDKIEEISGVLGIHPLTLCLLAYLETGKDAEIEALQDRIAAEVRDILAE